VRVQTKIWIEFLTVYKSCDTRGDIEEVWALRVRDNGWKDGRCAEFRNRETSHPQQWIFHLLITYFSIFCNILQERHKTYGRKKLGALTFINLQCQHLWFSRENQDTSFQTLINTQVVESTNTAFRNRTTLNSGHSQKPSQLL